MDVDLVQCVSGLDGHGQAGPISSGGEPLGRDAVVDQPDHHGLGTGERERLGLIWLAAGAALQLDLPKLRMVEEDQGHFLEASLSAQAQVYTSWREANGRLEQAAGGVGLWL
jgi:hypothetical protein